MWSYKSYQNLPTRMADFYDSLFQTLLQRHDGTKPGFTRSRTCPFDDSEYRRVFEALCFIAKGCNEQSFSYDAINELAARALCNCELAGSAQSYVNDMVKITCLIIRDGDEHRFIHKSVQEYYAAAYVQKRPGPWAQKFYARLAEKRADDRWGQELEFLSEIDKYRFGRHYLVPAICSFLGINEGQLDSVCPTCTTEMAPHIIDGIGFSQDRQSRKWYGNGIILGARVPPARKARSLLQATQTLVDLDDKILDDVRSQALAQWGNIEKGRYSDVFSTEALVKIPEIRDRLLKGLNAVFQELFAEARAVRQSLRKEEEPTILEGLI